MLNINSALLEQAVSLLDEHGIRHKASEAPRCASLTFSREVEPRAIKLLTDHFGSSIILGAVEDELAELARDVFETHEEADAWLRQPHPMLGMETPLNCAQPDDRVKDILNAVKHGGAGYA